MADPKDVLANLLKALGTADRKIKNTCKDPKLVAQLTEVLKEVDFSFVLHLQSILR